MDNIADRFKTSKTLVKKGLLEVEEFIKGYQLKLERKVIMVFVLREV